MDKKIKIQMKIYSIKIILIKLKNTRNKVLKLLIIYTKIFKINKLAD